MSSSKRNYSFDIIRAIACLAVIYVHVSADFISKFTNGEFGQKIVVFSNKYINFTVPVFIFLAGLTVLLSKKDIPNIKSYYLKRFKTIIPIYLMSV